MTVTPVKEDFFQRIVNVNWPHEPECFWWTGGGTNVAWLSAPSVLFMSDDGKTWSGGPGDRFTVCRGMWMRQGFVSKGKAVWLVFGHKGDPGRAEVHASYDGGVSVQHIPLEFDASDVYFSHFTNPIAEDPNNENRPTPAMVVVYTIRFSSFQCNKWTSTDGIHWDGTPGNYNIYAGTIPLFGWPNGPNNIRQDGNTQGATGKIKNGPRARLVATRRDAYSFMDPIQVTTDDGNKWTTTSGLGVIQGVQYGHNVFTVTGAIGGQSTGAIAFTEDGKKWYKSIAGGVDSLIMGAAVGPRAGASKTVANPLG